jgi:hypothetical protein
LAYCVQGIVQAGSTAHEWRNELNRAGEESGKMGRWEDGIEETVVVPATY